MVYGFAKQSRGHAKIYSEVGHGTTVRLYLPREDGTAAPSAPADEEVSVPSGNGETILLVEDDPQLRGIAMRMLSELGYRAIEAADGPAALRHLQEAGAAGSPVALLFTDLVLPAGGNGYQLAEAARERMPELKVLFTSGYSEEFVRRGGWSKSLDKLLTKPYRKQDLGMKLRSLLNA
jgi:CheY-like chemotaxis protein